ncbi:3-oxoacyl-ACP synthase III family protein [Streptomyces sp. NPDC021093]|uniref:3-oxoacyl-ACP synthase III family protein n=1 Tax=Streptomyces sp. NPDC021093 TaxID=3365112 RepID=UPI003790E859
MSLSQPTSRFQGPTADSAEPGTGLWYTLGGLLEPPEPAAPSAVGILGTGSYLPARVVSNDEVAAPAGVDDAWIVRKTGIRSRRYAAPDEATSDLAAHAARAALTNAGIGPGDLDFIVVATSTPDHPQPATAAIVQHAIGSENAASFDLNAVCSSFLFALNATAGLLPEGGHGLVIGADVYSRIINPADRRSAPLFGDGAGAVVLGPVPAEYGLGASVMETFGDLHRTIRVPAGGSRLPARRLSDEDAAHFFAMEGRAVRDFVTARLPLSTREVLRRSGLPPETIDHFIPHQANGQMLQDILPSLDLPRARVHLTVADYANTGAASVPVTLDAAHRSGALAEGDRLLLSAFGGGMSIASTVLRWGR